MHLPTGDEHRRRTFGGSAERAEAPPSWVRWGGGLLVLALLIIGGIVLRDGGERIGRPFPGFLLTKNRGVVPFGRPDWPPLPDPRILGAEVVGIDNHPVTSGADVETYVASLPLGAQVTYQFRRRGELFSATVANRLFTFNDYRTLYLTYFGVGLCFCLGGLWPLWQRRMPATVRFFAFCQTCALALVTVAELHAPYRFLALHFIAFALIPAALLDLAGSYPEGIGHGSRWRWRAATLLYSVMFAFGLALYLTAGGPFALQPLRYTGYLLLANALVIGLVHLWISYRDATDPRVRASLAWIAAGGALAALVPGTLFIGFPAARSWVSPTVIAGPLACFPLLAAVGLGRSPVTSPVSAPLPIRVRLSLLLIIAVETTFFIGVALFWLKVTDDQVFDDYVLNQYRQEHAQEFLQSSSPADAWESLVELMAPALDSAEQTHVNAAIAALVRDDLPAAHDSLGPLAKRYAQQAVRLNARRDQIDRLMLLLVIGLILSGIPQTVLFSSATRRWLIRPIDKLAATASMLATGNLTHRVELPDANEFTPLAAALNTMAASLAEIQQSVSHVEDLRRQAISQARGAEQRRLARELHDGVLQDLIVVKLRLETECKRFDPALQPIIDQLLATIIDIRRVVDDLRPPDLSAGTLGGAITAYARALAQTRKIAARLDLDTAVDVPEWATRDVYRIAQEALTNAVRHGVPRLLVVRLQRRQGEVILEISDDGSGFDVSRVAMGGGLQGMRERAAALGGELSIITSPGQGTTVRLVLPPSPPDSSSAPSDPT